MGGKRKHHNQQRSSSSRYRANPSRGPPGMLLTCETGREIKCEREGREILRFYLEKHNNNERLKSGESSKSTPNKKLSLDQELAALQQQPRQEDSGPFQLFDTGCGGTVFFMYVVKGDGKTIEASEGNEDTYNDGSASKRIRGEKAAENEKALAKSTSPVALEDTGVQATTTTHWDPVATFMSIASDISTSNEEAAASASASAIPSSRFVTRMIPIQVTCFATLKELERALTALLLKESGGTKPNENDNDKTGASGKSKTTKTFCIHSKKRNCNEFSTQQIIETAASLVVAHTGWTVQLEDPDHVIWIEICKTLMGVSLLDRHTLHAAKNFNIAELRDRQAEGKAEEDSTTP